MELLLKLLLGAGRVLRNAEQYRASLFYWGVAVPEAAGFLGAARRVRLGGKIKHYSLAAKIFQGNLFAVLIRRTEVWGFIINFHGIFSLPFLVISQWDVCRHLGCGDRARLLISHRPGSHHSIRPEG